MTTVYVLTVRWPYEGEALLGVYSTEDKANEALSGIRQPEEDLLVRAIEVDAPPEVR